MSTKSKIPACDVGFGLSHIDHIAIGNIVTTISVIALAVLMFAYIRSRPIADRVKT
jgi:hypothetical protein